MIVVGTSLNERTTHFGKILENGKKIIQIDDREDAFGWFARITVGLEADAHRRLFTKPNTRQHWLADALT